MSKLLKFLIISLLFLSACKRNEKYPEYSRTWTGIYYKFHSIGDEQYKPSEYDYVTVDLLYKTITDSVFFAGRRTLMVTKPEFRGAIDECFMMLSKGDCATFILNSENFFKKTLGTDVPSFLKKSTDFKVVIYLIDVMTFENFQKQKVEFLKWIDDFGEYESSILKDYIQKMDELVKPEKCGIYYLKLQDGNGKKVEKDDIVNVHYEGRFLNGDYFDSTRKRNQPFEFKYGQEWQVISGMEKAIGMMTEGEKAIFIMPSAMAFGPKGSSTGIIPPFTSVIFEVELLSVKSEKP